MALRERADNFLEKGQLESPAAAAEIENHTSVRIVQRVSPQLSDVLNIPVGSHPAFHLSLGLSPPQPPPLVLRETHSLGRFQMAGVMERDVLQK